MNQPRVFGYEICACGKPVRVEVTYKTNGRCAECFRKQAGSVIDAALVVVSGRERIVLRSKRSPTELAQRKRAKQRAKQDLAKRERQRNIARAHAHAQRRLCKLFPELFEVLLADERFKAGLDAWTIDRTLTPGTVSASLEFVQNYHHLTTDGELRAS